MSPSSVDLLIYSAFKNKCDFLVQLGLAHLRALISYFKHLQFQ